MELRHLTPLWIATVVVATAISPAAAKDPAQPNKAETAVTLVVRDGRVLNGHIDERTDDDLVWLRLNRGAVYLSTGLTWDLIQEVQIGSDRFTAADFRAVAGSYASGSPKLTAMNPDRSEATNSTVLVPSQNRLQLLGRVQSLQLTAEVANWDRDSESDGLALRVVPLGMDGRVLAIDGVLSVELVGREFTNGRNDLEGFPTLGQWSQRVRSTDFRAYEGAVYYLPTSRQLDHDLSVLVIGMVRAQLTVIGQGHYEAETPVRLRLNNPIRDQLDQHSSRYDAFGRYRARHW